MENTHRMQHDLRHHFTAIDGMLKNCEYEELGRYVAGFGVALPAGEPDEYCAIGVLNVLACHYDMLCKQNHIHFDLRSNTQKDNDGSGISDTDLCCLFGNLLENAVEACLRVVHGKRFIRVGVAHTGIVLTLSVENSTDENVRAEGDAFASGKGEYRKGCGLTSIRSIAEKHDGSAQFEWDKEKRMFTSVVTIMLS